MKKKHIAIVILGLAGIFAVGALVFYYSRIQGSFLPARGKSVPLPKIQSIQRTKTKEGVVILDDGLGFTVPEGFFVNIFSEGLVKPRLMALDPRENLLVADIGAGKIVMLPDADGDGRADEIKTLITGLKSPNSIGLYGEYLYVAETDSVSRYRYTEGRVGEREVIVPYLPSGEGHFTRTLLFRGDKMYVSVGSSCNACVEQNSRRAVILEFNQDGSGERVYAFGLRNSVGIALHPETQEIWATDNGRDWLGDTLPPEEINIIQDGGFYGWPNCYGDKVLDPQFGDVKKCESSLSPRFKFQAHTAPLGIIFYEGGLFPKEYRGNIFVAEHGSWNSSVPVGYKIIRFDEQNGEYVEKDFMTGFLREGGAVARPVGILVGEKGELYVSDDKSGRIFRITYQE